MEEKANWEYCGLIFQSILSIICTFCMFLCEKMLSLHKI